MNQTSNNISMGYICPNTKRVAVTARTLSLMDADTTAYIFSQEAESMGLECWRMVDSIEELGTGSYEIWFPSERSTIVEPDFILFVSGKDYKIWENS